MKSTQLEERRRFLKIAAIGVLPIAAFSFGCDISRALKSTHRKGAILYATRYGSTEETALWLAEGIKAETSVLNIESVDFSAVPNAYDFLILGSGIWVGGVHKEIKRFIQTEGSSIDGKVVATFVVCGSRGDDPAGQKRIQGYLDQINQHLTQPPKLSTSFGGRLVLDRLRPEDKEALTRFYKNFLKKPLEGWNYMDKTKTVSFGNQVAESIAGLKLSV